MANPLAFKPEPVDPHLELERRLSRAPREHAEALLVVYDILEAAHQNGSLDAVHGLVSARDKIFGRLAEFANTPEGKDGLLNILQLAAMLASLDPALVKQLADALEESSAASRREERPPSMWQLFRRATSDDSRRALSFVTLLLSSMGRSFRRK